jgi:hypothetical protein
VFLATFIESTRENYKNLLYPYEKHRYFKWMIMSEDEILLRSVLLYIMDDCR